MVEAASIQEISSYEHQVSSVTSEFIDPLAETAARSRFDEILDARRREISEERHRRRVKILEEAAANGQIVFTSRIEH